MNRQGARRAERVERATLPLQIIRLVEEAQESEYPIQPVGQSGQIAGLPKCGAQQGQQAREAARLFVHTVLPRQLRHQMDRYQLDDLP